MNLETYSYVSIPILYPATPTAVTYSPDSDKIYFLEKHADSSSTIRSIDLLGTNLQVLENMQSSSVINMDYDENVNSIFFTDDEKHAILRSRVNGVGTNIVMIASEKPVAIALDKINQMVYWSDCGYSPMIGRAKYDGSQREVVTINNMKCPNGLAVDPREGLVYFCDEGTQSIESMSLDGSDRKVLYKDNGARFSGLTLSSQHIYYSDLNKHSVMKLNRNGTAPTPAGPPSFSKIVGLYAYQSKFL
jgi:DNA-binding beta-propeller fold protein YncE